MGTRLKPSFLERQGIFWTRDASQLDKERDKEYIIHQTLAFGSLDDLRWLKTIYPLFAIRSVFVSNPRGLYTPQAFLFIARYVLGLDASTHLDERSYLKSRSRYS